jgi:hypothetical protein
VRQEGHSGKHIDVNMQYNTGAKIEMVLSGVSVVRYAIQIAKGISQLASPCPGCIWLSEATQMMLLQNRPGRATYQ